MVAKAGERGVAFLVKPIDCSEASTDKMQQRVHVYHVERLKSIPRTRALGESEAQARALALVKEGMGTVEAIEAITPVWARKHGHHRVRVKWLNVDSTTATQLNLQWIEANRLKRNAVLRAHCEASGWNFDQLVNDSINLQRPKVYLSASAEDFTSSAAPTDYLAGYDLDAVGAATESSIAATGTGAPAPPAAAERAEPLSTSTPTTTSESDSTQLNPTSTSAELAFNLNLNSTRLQPLTPSSTSIPTTIPESGSTPSNEMAAAAAMAGRGRASGD